MAREGPLENTCVAQLVCTLLRTAPANFTIYIVGRDDLAEEELAKPHPAVYLICNIANGQIKN